MRVPKYLPRVGAVLAAGAVAATVSALPALAQSTTQPTATGTTSPATFSTGQLQATTPGKSGCGTNVAGEPSIHVSRDGLVGISSEDGLLHGSQYWRGTQTDSGTSSADACGLTYSGQPNAVAGVGAAGGDTDSAFAPDKSTAGTRRIYVASLNLGSVNVATSTDDGKTFHQTPVQAGLPLDDREWIAAYGADTSLLSYHDVATNNIDMLRSDNGGLLYQQISRVIPDGDYKATNNELGNLVIDHRNSSGTPGGFLAYQSFVAPSTPTGSALDEAFLGVSADGGHTWTDKPIPCSTQFGDAGLNHQFPNVSVAPDGSLDYAVSNDTSVYTAHSSDRGQSWTCSGPVSTPKRAILPWIVSTDGGQDLVYYGTPDGQTWYAYFAQRRTGDQGWTTTKVTPVHKGEVCEGGISCTTGRQLLDDFGVDTDPAGFAHIAYSHDSPDLGGPNTYTGHAVQTGGSPVGQPN